MKDLHFEGLDLYKGDKLQGYIKKMKTQKIHKINIFFGRVPNMQNILMKLTCTTTKRRYKLQNKPF